MLLTNIQKLCAEKKTSIAQLERACGLANATIRRWDASSPSVENLLKVADFFEVSLDSLLDRSTYILSDATLRYAELFEELSDDKKQLAIAYMGVVKAQ